MKIPFAWLPFILFATSAYAQMPAASQRPIVFTGATIIDVKVGRPRPGMSIVVVGNRIAAVGRTGNVRIPTDAHVIDASGKYLIPGLWDMHAHVGASGDLETTMPLMVANGVTGLREMASDCISEANCLESRHDWQQQIETGELLGPRLLALSGWFVNGPRGLPKEVPAFFSAATAEHGRQLARYFAERKPDFIKVGSNIPRDGFFGLAAEARRLGLVLAGHVPRAVSAIEASNSGFKSFEHARVFLFNCFPRADEFRLDSNAALDTKWRRRMVDEYDPGICRRVFRTFVHNETRYVPTHLTRKMEAFADDPAFRRDARLKYIPRAQRQAWNEDADRMVAQDPSPEGRKAMMDFYKKGLEITGAAQKAGVIVMVGTDSGDSYVFPGFAVHDELQELVTAGLTPAAALKAATWNGAEFLGRTSDFGSIEQGKLADLVILEANPLTDIRNSRRIAAVMLNGRYLDRGVLDRLLSSVETAANR